MEKVKINVNKLGKNPNRIDVLHVMYTDEPSLICNADNIKVKDKVLKIMSYDVILHEDDTIEYIILNVI